MEKVIVFYIFENLFKFSLMQDRISNLLFIHFFALSRYVASVKLYYVLESEKGK